MAPPADEAGGDDRLVEVHDDDSGVGGPRGHQEFGVGGLSFRLVLRVDADGDAIVARLGRSLPGDGGVAALVGSGLADEFFAKEEPDALSFDSFEPEAGPQACLQSNLFAGQDEQIIRQQDGFEATANRIHQIADPAGGGARRRRARPREAGDRQGPMSFARHKKIK